MSKLFFDHLVDLDEVNKQINKITNSSEEKAEFWQIIDEIVHHKVMGCILDKLPRENHDEFLQIFHKNPHDQELIIGYLKKQIGDNIEDLIKQEIGGLNSDLLETIKSS